jgi:hypothetical protein
VKRPGDTTAWYTAFWTFSAAYLNTRFGTDSCLSPALENASVGQDILPFATFLGDLVKAALEGHPAAKAPEIPEPHVNVSSSG